jgi:hypothetical protein
LSIMFRLAVVAGLVAYAAAQSVSQQCANAVASIAADPAASQCLAIGAFIPVVTSGTNTSIVQPLNNWINSMCSAPACSNDTIAAVVKNFTTGCSAELAAAGIGSDALPTITATVQALYPTLRKVACLKHGSTFCLTETLTNVETVTGPLTLSNLAKIAQNPPTSLPANITCTDCNKEVYNIFAKDFPASVTTLTPALQSQCGAAFVDGQTPSGITQSATTSIASGSLASKSSAFSLISTFANSVTLAMSASGLVVASTIYTLLV